MTEHGMKVFSSRDKTKANLYSFEQDEIKFTPAQLKVFKKNKKAWDNFSAMPPGYRRTATWYVISAKQEETRLRRLSELMKDSESGKKIKQLARPEKKK
jgi:uncharacterized protein YdeI (YjbR/CyaY-like superfamily)